MTVTAGLRINAADISGRDRSGSASDLTGNHGYGHVNPLAGFTYKFDAAVSLFGGYSQANRAPTPLESRLRQSRPARACWCVRCWVIRRWRRWCHIPGRPARAGSLSGLLGDDHLNWTATFFRTDSDNDIIALASAIAGHGFFTNIP